MKHLGRINLFLLLLLIMTFLINWSLKSAQPARGWQLLPDMVSSPSFDSYSSNPHLPGQRTMQVPPEGTIARGLMPLSIADPESEHPGSALTSPQEASREDLLPEGRRIFGNFCSPCHGNGGEGNGQVVLRGFPAPPSLLADQARSLTDGEIFYILSFGRNNMPSYSKLISGDQRWKAITYVRHLQELALQSGEENR